MAAAIPPAVAPRIGALLRLLGSDHDGEALGAIRALRRTLDGVGLDLHALAEAVEHPVERVVVIDSEAPEPAARRPRRARPGDVVLDGARQTRVVAALRRGLGAGRLSEWERTFAASIVERLQHGRGRLTEKQGETLGRLLGKIGEGAAWA